MGRKQKGMAILAYGVAAILVLLGLLYVGVYETVSYINRLR